MGRSSRVVVSLVALFVFACAGNASRVPRGNTTPEGSETYFYGPLDVSEQAVVDKPSSLSRQVARAPQKKHEASSDESAAKDTTDTHLPGKVSNSTEWTAKWLGDHRGYDRVELDVPGVVPVAPQEDDNALLRVSVVSEGEAESPVLKFAVVDSNDGTTPLCEVEGVLNSPNDATVAAGQPCFTRMLGVPLEATTQPGNAALNNGVITLSFGVVLLVPAPDGQTLEGSLKYLFKG